MIQWSVLLVSVLLRPPHTSYQICADEDGVTVTVRWKEVDNDVELFWATPGLRSKQMVATQHFVMGHFLCFCSQDAYDYDEINTTATLEKWSKLVKNRVPEMHIKQEDGKDNGGDGDNGAGAGGQDGGEEEEENGGGGGDGEQPKNLFMGSAAKWTEGFLGKVKVMIHGTVREVQVVDVKTKKDGVVDLGDSKRVLAGWGETAQYKVQHAMSEKLELAAKSVAELKLIAQKESAAMAGRKQGKDPFLG